MHGGLGGSQVQGYQEPAPTTVQQAQPPRDGLDTSHHELATYLTCTCTYPSSIRQYPYHSTAMAGVPAPATRYSARAPSLQACTAGGGEGSLSSP